MFTLVGAHSTGKTTLLKALQQQSWRFEGYTSDGFSRPMSLIRKSLNLTAEQEQIAINELTCWAFENYISQRVISTRSPIDAIIYTQYYTPTLNTSSIKELFNKYKDKIEGIFYIPIEFELENDGVRFTDIQGQKDIDLLMQQFLKDNNLPFITITGSVEERVNQVLSAMKFCCKGNKLFREQEARLKRSQLHT